MMASLLHYHLLHPALRNSSKERHSFSDSSYRRLVGDESCSKVRVCSSRRTVPFSFRNGSTEAIKLKSKTLDKSSTNLDHMVEYEHQLQELFTEIKKLLAMGNKSDALNLLQANYEVVKGEVTSGSKGIEQVALLDILALGYMGAGELSMLEDVLQMMKEMIGALDDCMPLMDSILMHMGSMFTNLGKHEDAILVYDRGLKILENMFGNESPFLITPLMGMAKVYRLIGRATKATQIYHKTISILEKKRGTESEELVLPLFNLGNLLINERKAVDAEACFIRILSIHVKVYGANDGRVGIAMCSLAHALCAKGSADEAICMYKKGLQVIKDSKYAVLDDDVLEKMRIDLAELLHVTGREQEGRELLEECLLITEKMKGIGYPSTVVHLVNLAASHSRSKNFVEAERLLRASLEIMMRNVMPDDQSVTVPMLHLAVALYHMGRDAEAETLALEAVRIRENAFGKESLPVGEALDCLVSIQTRLGKDDNLILDQLRRILAIQERELGYESEVTLETLKKVIFYLDKMGKKDEKFPLERRLQSLRNKHKYGVAV